MESHGDWETVEADFDVWEAYTRQRKELLAAELDWDAAYNDAAPLLKDTHEWIGHLEMRDGKPRIKDKKRSLSTNEDEFHLNKIEISLTTNYLDKPSLFMFHTHPSPEYSEPSINDFITAVSEGCLERSVQVLFSSSGTFVYTMSDKMRDKILTSGRARFAKTAYMYSLCLSLAGSGARMPHPHADIEYYRSLGLYVRFYPTKAFEEDTRDYVYSADLSKMIFDENLIARLRARHEKEKARLK